VGLAAPQVRVLGYAQVSAAATSTDCAFEISAGQFKKELMFNSEVRINEFKGISGAVRLPEEIRKECLAQWVATYAPLYHRACIYVKREPRRLRRSSDGQD
ncbi:MAG: hypothetical protein Q9175_007343, partial [Cornicularia normoerica]